jgi:hypothetical protein
MTLCYDDHILGGSTLHITPPSYEMGYGGGWSDGNREWEDLQSFMCYDLSNCSWTILPPLLSTRLHARMVYISTTNIIYLLGKLLSTSLSISADGD